MEDFLYCTPRDYVTQTGSYFRINHRRYPKRGQCPDTVVIEVFKCVRKFLLLNLGIRILSYTGEGHMNVLTDVRTTSRSILTENVKVSEQFFFYVCVCVVWYTTGVSVFINDRQGKNFFFKRNIWYKDKFIFCYLKKEFKRLGIQFGKLNKRNLSYEKSVELILFGWNLSVYRKK